MPGQIEVLQVTVPGAAPGLRHAAIDKPRVGPVAGGGWSLDVRGTALGDAGPVTHVEFVTAPAGEVIHTAACDVPRPRLAEERPDLAGAEDSGFYATLGGLDLHPEFELHLRAVAAGGGRIPFGTITGRRARLETSFEPGMQPLLVTGPGRSGSTIFMQMLAGHPQILAWPPFEQEPRVMTYWIEVLRALARPDSFMRQVAPAGNLNGDWWLGGRDPRPRALGDEDVQAWLAGEAVEELAAFAQSRVESLYRRLAARDGRDRVAFFAEKLRNDIVSDLAWELYPQAREVVLVRDPRDVLCSVLAANVKRGQQPPPADPMRWIGDEFEGRIAAVAQSWERRSDRAHLVRYEDLMLDPVPTLCGLLGYLGLDAGEEAARGMLAAAQESLPAMSEHRTTPDPQASIGRFERDLDPALREECERRLGDAIALFGYSVGAAHQA
ncbi:MAG TPA: sulfotransferase [Solirubrobacterales bacterium]|nr:sulfotransferase [Solirubrobacterales bacterium]